MAKLAAQQGAEAEQSLLPLQIGVAGRGPWLQAGVLTVRSWVSILKSGHVILKIDLKNAYDSIHRHQFWQLWRSAALNSLPGLAGAWPAQRGCTSAATCYNVTQVSSWATPLHR